MAEEQKEVQTLELQQVEDSVTISELDDPEKPAEPFDPEAATEHASDWYKDPKVKLVLETFNGDIIDVRKN